MLIISYNNKHITVKDNNLILTPLNNNGLQEIYIPIPDNTTITKLEFGIDINGPNTRDILDFGDKILDCLKILIKK